MQRAVSWRVAIPDSPLNIKKLFFSATGNMPENARED